MHTFHILESKFWFSHDMVGLTTFLRSESQYYIVAQLISVVDELEVSNFQQFFLGYLYMGECLSDFGVSL